MSDAHLVSARCGTCGTTFSTAQELATHFHHSRHTQTFTTGQVAESARVTERQLRHWIDRGYLRPWRKDQVRPERNLKWNESEVQAAKVLGALSRAMGPGGQSLFERFGRAMAPAARWNVDAVEGIGVKVNDGDLEVEIVVRPT